MRKTLTYSNPEVELVINGTVFSVDVSATAEYYYSPGSMYRSNGDPGDPPESELEITNIESFWTYFDDINDATVEIEPTKDMEAEIEEYLYNLDYDDWTEQDDYEYDDYEYDGEY